MKLPPETVLHRVLFALHAGLSDLRYLAKSGKCEQAYELGDTLENIPGLLVNWEDSHLERIKAQLLAYQAKYSRLGWCEYAKYLDQEAPPDSF